MKQDEAKLGLSMSGNARIGICQVQYLHLPGLTILWNSTLLPDDLQGQEMTDPLYVPSLR